MTITNNSFIQPNFLLSQFIGIQTILNSFTVLMYINYRFFVLNESAIYKAKIRIFVIVIAERIVCPFIDSVIYDWKRLVYFNSRYFLRCR